MYTDSTSYSYQIIIIIYLQNKYSLLILIIYTHVDGFNNFYLILIIIYLHTINRYQVFLSNINNFQTDLFDRTWTGTTIPGQSGPGSNSNKEMTPNSPDLQNWSLMVRCHWVSCQGTSLWWRVLTLQQKTLSAYSNLTGWPLFSVSSWLAFLIM